MSQRCCYTQHLTNAVGGRKTEEGKEYHRLHCKGRNENNIDHTIQWWLIFTQNSRKENESLVSSTQFSKPGT